MQTFDLVIIFFAFSHSFVYPIEAASGFCNSVIKRMILKPLVARHSRLFKFFAGECCHHQLHNLFSSHKYLPLKLLSVFCFNDLIQKSCSSTRLAL